MADISAIKELAAVLCLGNIANGLVDLSDETVSNTDYLYNVLKQEIDIRAKKKITSHFYKRKPRVKAYLFYKCRSDWLSHRSKTERF